MGDISFSLTLKSRIEEETNKIIKELNKVDSTGKQAQNVLEAISEATKGIGDKGGAGFKKLSDFISELRNNIKIFSSEDFFSPKKVQQLEAVENGLYRIGRILEDVSKKGTGFSIFPNNVSTEGNKAERELYKLSSFINEINKRHGEGVQLLGVDSTNNIRQSLSELSKYRTELEQIRNNGGIHPVTGLTASDVVKSAGFLNAIDEAKTYAKEVKNSIKEVEKAREDAKKKADAAIENQKKIDSGETAYYAKIRDILQQIDALSKGMMPFLNATAGKNMVFPSHLVDDLKKLYSVQQTLLANNHAGRNMGLDWLKDFQNRNGFSVITKELKDFIANAEEARKRYVRLFDVLNELRNTRAVANMAGVDTSKIDSQIASTLTALKELRTIMQTGIGNTKSVIGSDSRSVTLAERTNKEVRDGIRLEQKRQQEIAQTGARIQSDLVRGFEKANSHAGKLNSTVQDLKSLFLQGGLVFGAQQFAMSIITTGGEMEKQHIALQSILGDMQNANTMFNQIKELALNSPFTFSELNRDVKQLAAYGVEYDQLYDTTKRLADMSSGLGVSFDRIALAFGQVQARGWLDGKELRQIAYAGIPLLNKLSEFYSKQEGRNVSTSEIKTRISNREISFDDVKSIFWQMTDEGGQFYNMQQILSETLLGKYNKLKDAWEIMLSDFASGQSIVGKTFKVAIEGVTGLVQSLHTLAPVIVAAFSGFALKKAGTMIAGSYGTNYLKNKASVASNIQSRVIQGQAISNVEKSVLATKNQITNAEVRQLVLANAIHKKELDRLFVEGKISASVYKQGLAAVGLASGMTKAQVKAQLLGNTINRAASGNIWATFGARGLAAMSLIGNAVKGLGATLWSAIGGLPGLILTAVTMGITYAISKYQELSNAIDQTRSELKDREKQIADFRNTNVKAANDAIASGDTKEIDNLIETYKDKLKELAPYNFSNLEMTAYEKKSHVDRLIYLDKELKRLQMANKEAQKHLDNRSFYSGLQDAFKSAQIDAHAVEEQKVKANAYNATDEDRNKLQRYTELYKRDINVLKQTLVKEFGDIGKNPTLLAAAMQALDSIAAQMGISEEQKETIRASILDSFGLQSGWLKEQVGIKMQSIIDEKFPEIAAKIKANIPLTQAEQEKVKELMQDAKQGLIRQYPELERTLQNLLAESNFQAVIKLVYDTGGKYNDVQSTLVGRIPSMINPKSSIGAKYRQRADEYGKDNDWYKANNLANQRIDDARNAWKGAVKSHAPNVKDIYQNYLDEMAISRTLLYNNYKGTDKKSNKPGKKNTHTNHEDKELKRLQERIELYKKMYAEIKKFKELYGEGALGQLANDGEFGAIFGDKKRFPVSDYTNYETSIKELLKGFSLSTPERKHYAETQKAAIQSENRKLLQDQRRDELDLLNRELDVISAQYDTYKKLYELTGNKKGAENIAFDGAVQYDTYKKFLEKQLDIAVNHDNVQSGLKLTTDEVKGMSLDNVKDRYGSESRVYDIRKKLDDETRKIKQETIDLLANLVEKNATIDQQIEDENRKYERQLELIKGIKDTGMRDRATEGAEKTHNENLAKLEFERFKQGSDWVTIFDDLDRVSSTTINSMVEKIDEFSKTTGLSVEVVKQLRDALGKLRDEQIDRNPINGIIGGMQRGNAIGSFIDSRFRKGMDISTTTYVGADDAKKWASRKETTQRVSLKARRREHTQTQTRLPQSLKKSSRLCKIA